MGAFDSGFSQGRQIYNDAFEQKRQAKRDAMVEEEFGQKRTVYNQTQDQYKRTLGIQSDSDASTDNYKKLVLRGRAVGLAATQTPEPNDPGTDGSPSASPASPAYQGGTAPQAPPTVGLRAVGATPGVQAPAAGGMAQATAAAQAPARTQAASPREFLQARMEMAVASRDSAAYAGLTAELQTMDRKDYQRNRASTLLAMRDDPAQAEAFKKAIAPAIKAFSEFNGVPNTYQYDPRTKNMVETPYGKTDAKTGVTTYGTPREIPFATLLPYMMAHDSLTSEYGDPETAAAQMKNMSDAERTKRVDEAKQTLESAYKVSSAAAAQTHAGASMISAGAAATSAGAAVMNARTNAAYKDEQVGEIRENRKNLNYAAEIAGKYGDLSPEQQAGPAGKGLLREFDMAKSKSGGPGVSPRGLERPPMTNKDLMDFAEKMGGSPTTFPNPKKPGTPLTVSQLNPAQLREAASVYFGVAQQGSGTVYKAGVTPDRGSTEDKSAPVAQPRRYDSDGNPIPMDPASVNTGYGTGPDVRQAARGLLRTPSYSAGGTQFNPN